MWAFWGLVSSCRVEGVYNFFFLILNALLFLNKVYKNITLNNMLSLLTLPVMLFSLQPKLSWGFVLFGLGFFSFCFGFGFFFLARRHI